VHPIAASPLYEQAIAAVADLLTRQRLAFVFAGSVARAAHLGAPIDGGSIDVIATMGPQQKNQVAMMASNRGFRVEREEIEAAEELDLIPMRFEGVRIHVLVASNALYGRMVADGVVAELPGSGMVAELPGSQVADGVVAKLPGCQVAKTTAATRQPGNPATGNPATGNPATGNPATGNPSTRQPEIRVPKIEDLALLLQMSNDVTSLMKLIDSPEFDRDAYNRKMVSIGLRELVVPG
jgi:hypothetical protein